MQSAEARGCPIANDLQAGHVAVQCEHKNADLLAAERLAKGISHEFSNLALLEVPKSDRRTAAFTLFQLSEAS